MDLLVTFNEKKKASKPVKHSKGGNMAAFARTE
jgi:hypothetical protein